MSVLLPRTSVDSSVPDVGYSESALAEELARIMKKKPSVAPAKRDLEAAKSIRDGQIFKSEAEAEPASEPIGGIGATHSSERLTMPAWAVRGRRGRGAGVRGVRMVGASLLAVTVVVAIIGTAAAAMFGPPADVGAVKKLLTSPWKAAAGGTAAPLPRGMAAASASNMRLSVD